MVYGQTSFIACRVTLPVFPNIFWVKVILGDVFNATVDRVNHSISREMVLTDDTDVHESME